MHPADQFETFAELVAKGRSKEESANRFGVTVGLVQRRLVAIPIGMLIHLLLDGIWTDTRAFWWPFAGLAWSDARLPELARGRFDLVLEAAGAAALWWCWRRFRLFEPERRRRFLRTGQLDRDVAGP